MPLPGGPHIVSEGGDSRFGIVCKKHQTISFQRSAGLCPDGSPGRSRPNSDVWNVSQLRTGTARQLLLMNGKNTVPRLRGPGREPSLRWPKLKATKIGDTLAGGADDKPLPAIAFPEAVMSYALTAAKSGEDEKIAAGLHKIAECDPTVRLSRNDETHEAILGVMGDQHLAIVVKRLKEQFKVEAVLSTPKVPYRETITNTSEEH